MKAIDLTGQRFGRLLVLRIARSLNRKKVWVCACDCGKTSIAWSPDLKRGVHTSCGCFHKEIVTKHGCSWQNKERGHGRSREYSIWSTMKQRCENPNHAGYKDYGGRGIRVHGPWRESFEAFVVDVGLSPSSKHSLDRYPDTNGNYEPGNVRWATKKQQGNNRRDNHRYEHDGKNLTLPEWADLTGLDYEFLRARVRLGWSIEKAITTPKKQVWARDHLGRWK